MKLLPPLERYAPRTKSTCTADVLDSCGLCIYLTEEVEVNRVVDGHEVVDSRDGADIVHIADGSGHAHAVVIQEVINPLAAGGEGVGLAAMVDALVGAADLAAQG